MREHLKYNKAALHPSSIKSPYLFFFFKEPYLFLKLQQQQQQFINAIIIIIILILLLLIKNNEQPIYKYYKFSRYFMNFYRDQNIKLTKLNLK